MDGLFLGIDLGTSGAKAALVGPDETVLARATRPLAVSVPRPGWSEQDPRAWIDAVGGCLDALADGHARAMARVAGIGLSGQMLGAVVLDDAMRPLRPAILWNDRRAVAECAVLLERVPDIGMRTNGAPDPGLPGPKLLWLARHEPEVAARAAMMMMPKDHLRHWLTGAVETEPSDAGGTMLMDVARACWDPNLCEAAGWDSDRLPPVVASTAVRPLRGALTRRWRLPDGVAVTAGAGDNMACALGVGVVGPGPAAVTLGTSAVVNAAATAFRPAPGEAILTAPHAVPGAFLSMAVVMNGTSALDWIAGLSGRGVPDLVAAAEALVEAERFAGVPIALPAFNGLRTPLNRPRAGAAIEGIGPRTDAAALTVAAMEGVAHQLRDCNAALTRAGVPTDGWIAVGGGARSRTWRRILATLLDRPVALAADGPDAAVLGAARLAAVGAGETDARVFARPARIAETVDPVPEWAGVLFDRGARARRLASFVADGAV